MTDSKYVTNDTPSETDQKAPRTPATVWGNVYLPEVGERSTEIGGMPFTAGKTDKDDRVIAWMLKASEALAAHNAALPADATPLEYITIQLKPNWMDGSFRKAPRELPAPVLHNPFA